MDEAWWPAPAQTAVAFLVGYALVAFLVCLSFGQLIGGRSGVAPGEHPAWVRDTAVVIGGLLLVGAVAELRSTLRHHRDDTVRKPPAWIVAADRTSVRKSAGLGVVLDLNPVNVSMMLAAAATLGAYGLPIGHTSPCRPSSRCWAASASSLRFWPPRCLACETGCQSTACGRGSSIMVRQSRSSRR